jgi:hypothetical protein
MPDPAEAGAASWLVLVYQLPAKTSAMATSSPSAALPERAAHLA